MGAGLYHDPEGITVYAEPFDHIAVDDEDAQGAVDDTFEIFMEEIFENLSGSWFEVDRWRNRVAHVVAANGLFELSLHQDDYCRVHLTVSPRTDLDPRLEGLAKGRLHSVAHAFFGRIGKAYPLRVRTSAWTSAAYKPEVRAA